MQSMILYAVGGAVWAYDYLPTYDAATRYVRQTLQYAPSLSSIGAALEAADNAEDPLPIALLLYTLADS